MVLGSANSDIEAAFPSAEATQSPSFSSKKIIKIITANSLEFTGTAIQIASEITIFVAGMGFFISPPLKKVYAELEGKNMQYSINGNGLLCIDNPRKDLLNFISFFSNNRTLQNETSSNSLCLKINDQPLLSSNIVFDLAYPEKLFSASVFLFSLSCSGLLAAFVFRKLGALLHEENTEIPPPEQQLVNARRMYWPITCMNTISLLGSRIAAIYSTSTISMTMNLRSVPGILADFSIPSSKQLTYDLRNSAMSSIPELNDNLLFQVISLTMHFITYIDFSELRNAAELGSKKIDSYDYLIGLAMAAVALILGHLALKTQQQKQHYETILLRHQHAQDLYAGMLKKPSAESERTEKQRPLSTTNPNRMFGARIPTQVNRSNLEEDDLRLEV